MDGRQQGLRGSGKGRQKKLTEYASWRFEFNGQEALDACRAQRRMLQDRTSTEFPEDACACPGNRTEEQIEAGGKCRYSPPDVGIFNVGVVGLYDLSYGSSNYAGMDGIPTGKSLSDVESLARALGIPWDQSTIERFMILEAAFLKHSHEEYKKRKK